MITQRKDLRVLQVKTKEGVRPTMRLSVRYRSRINNSVKKSITDMKGGNWVNRRYKVTQSGRPLILEFVSKVCQSSSEHLTGSSREQEEFYAQELERKIGREVWDRAGEGIEGLDRVRSRYKGIGGVYAFVNIEKSKIYIGSSKNLARRMGEYKNMEIHNKRLLEDVKEGNWGGFEILIILKEEEREERIRKEYEMMSKVREKTGYRLYNVFIRKEDQEEYGGKVTIARGERVPGETKEKIRRNARAQGRGERLKEYRFKEGLENINAKRVRVLDILSREVNEGIIEEVINKTGGTRTGLLYAMKNKTRYKKRYMIFRVERGEEENAVEKGERNKGQFKTGKENIKYREVMLENVETGEIRVVPLKDVPLITEGTRDGVMRAIRDARIYKRRYRISYIEKEII